MFFDKNSKLLSRQKGDVLEDILKTIELLLYAGANPYVCNNEGNTFLQTLEKSRHPGLIEIANNIKEGKYNYVDAYSICRMM